MAKKVVSMALWLIALLVLATIALEAASKYRMPSKYKGLSLGVKFDHKKMMTPPCVKYGCSAWHTAVGDKDAKKSYRCGCNVPSSLKKEKAVCFMSPSASKRAGYREQLCRR